ncbi:MAG: hypothetical protein RLZZ522_555 [Verrucomicrobiota bacterium]
MSNQARISSIDALEAFRAELIRYIEHARVALEDLTGDARRTRTWLDVDCTQHWAGQLKKRTKQLHQAEEELYRANLTNPQASNAFQKMAVQRAKRKLEEAEAKMHLIKRWRQVYDNRTTPLLHQLEPMFAQVGQQLPKAVHALTETIKILQAYAESGRPAAPKARPAEGPGEEVRK